MALDFAILGTCGAPEKTVSIGMGLHRRLISAASASGLPRFEAFAEYFDDAEISYIDLPDFGEQVRTLRNITEDCELAQFLDKLGELVECAIVNGKSLCAIAD
jgi:hypothetical protein